MAELVWIHRFNAQELGIAGRGPYCLVPVDARVIFLPNIDLSENPDVDEEIELYLDGVEQSFTLSYKKPGSKTEHRLYLAGLRNFIGDSDSSRLIQPGKIGCFYRKGQQIFLSVADAESAYGRLLERFPSRGANNNVITQSVFENASQNSPNITTLSNEVTHLTTLCKPFILLAGISGTGKTRFVRKQAENGNGEKCYELVSVRPDWHEPSDLLGYISRLSGTPQYVVTDVLRFIASAWKKVADAGLQISVVASNGHEQIAIDGDQTTLELLGPQWLCLDEMNLAPVEQYFADYLSVLETREWSWNDDSFTYKSDALLKPSIFKQLPDESLITLKNDLGFGENDNELWDFVIQHGLGLPPQLIVAGTVNMDETTHGFSRKVIDRALTYDFGEFYPNVLDQFFDSETTNKTLTYPTHSQAHRDYLPPIDSDGKLSIEFIEKINAVLENTPFKLAYRALNELLLAVISHQPADELELKAVWDDFLMCKVLPRIEGDADKLAANDSQKESVLHELADLLETEFSEFWNASSNNASARPDLLRGAKDTNDPVIRIACRSKKKLKWMQSRLSASGFTSFWP